MSDSKGVRFGVSNVHYALYTEGTGNEAGTYAAPVAMPGCTAITLTPQGNTWTFYADNIAYEAGTSNTGYEVSLTIAVVGDQAKIDLLGFKADSNGVVYEPADNKPGDAALLWEFDGSKVKKRGLLYSVKFARPTESAQTKTESIEPDTDELTGTAIGRDFTIGTKKENVIKASVTDETSTKTQFDGWFSAVYVPAGE